MNMREKTRCFHPIHMCARYNEVYALQKNKAFSCYQKNSSWKILIKKAMKRILWRKKQYF